MEKKFCTNCGKPIVGEGKFCASCGASVIETEVQGADSTARPEVNVEKKANRTRRLVWFAAAVGVVLVAIAAIFMLIGGENSIKLPYGLDKDMSVGEARECMEDNGFNYDHILDYSYCMSVFFESKYIYRYNTIFTVVEIDNDGDLFYVSHFYDEESAGETLGVIYSGIRADLIDEYGSPSADSENWCNWYSGDYGIMLNLDNDGVVLTFEYDVR